MRVLTEGDARRWDDFVLRSASSNGYHQIAWRDVIERSFGHRTFYLLSEADSGSVDGVLPLVQLKSCMFGNFLVSLPYFNYGGVCAASEHAAHKLLTEAKFLAGEIGVEHIEFRHTEHSFGDLPVKRDKVSMRLALAGGAEGLFKSFPAKLRSQIRRPEKEGMVCEIGRNDKLDDFYAVFAENMRDLGTPVYARAFFGNILEAFPRSSWICTVATGDGRPVAAAFLVGFRGMMEIPWASSLRRYNALSPNMLLYWNVLKFACESGYSVFDFGRSTPGEGTYRFKEQWGAKPEQLYWHYWLRNSGTLPELNPKNPKYQVAIRLWKRLPLPVTRMFGPAIVKYLP